MKNFGEILKLFIILYNARTQAKFFDVLKC